ncbi:NUMOD4 domain-containing protein [Vibrio lentus]
MGETKKLSEYNARDIEGYEGLYAITDCGKVYSHSRVDKHGRLFKGRWLKQFIDTYGYHTVKLSRAGDVSNPQKVHRLVALAFIPTEHPTLVVDHVDENKSNNCVSNLQWLTIGDNAAKSLAGTFTFISPTGEITNIHNMRKFCTDNNLNSGSMSSVWTGRRRSHKGWTKYKEVA